MSKKIKILGLDPSLSNFGIVGVSLDIDTLQLAVEKMDLVQTDPEKDKKLKKVVRKNSEDLERGRVLHEGLHSNANGFQLAIAEVPVGSQSSRAMASYGVCIGILASCPVPLIQVTPTEVKVAATGIKTATKEEMIEWATEKYPDAPWLTMGKGDKKRYLGKNEHLADALAAIHAGIKTDEFKSLLNMYRTMSAQIAA